MTIYEGKKKLSKRNSNWVTLIFFLFCHHRHRCYVNVHGVGWYLDFGSGAGLFTVDFGEEGSSAMLEADTKEVEDVAEDEGVT